MRNAGLEEAQAGIKIAGRNINNFRYGDDTTLMAENEEELKSLLMKVKEESGKAGLELNNQKTKIMASGSHEMALFLGRKAMTNLESILKSRDITLPTKVHLVKESESESEVTYSCPTLCDHMDCSPPGSSIHGIF